MVEKTIEYYKPRVGMMSCVGIGEGKFPLSFGNYMALSDGPYLVNMWAENLKEWARRNPDVDTIEITVLNDGKHYLGFVTDGRLKGWTNDRMCVTGHGWGSRELCEAAHELMGQEVGDCICGCEAPEQSPRMCKTFSFNNPVTMHHCNNCGRTWETTRG